MESTLYQLSIISESIDTVDKMKNDTVNSIQGISAITEENAASAEQISATMDTQNDLMESILNKSNEMMALSEKLKEIIKKFSI